MVCRVFVVNDSQDSMGNPSGSLPADSDGILSLRARLGIVTENRVPWP